MRKFNYWFGDEESLTIYEKAQETSFNTEALRARGSDSEDGLPLLTVHGNVGVIEIKGGLLSSSNWVTRWLGITTYTDIRNSLIDAAENNSIDTILLDMDTPGGSAQGVDDVSNLINQIKESKQVVAHTSRLMASAGYWIGSAAHEVYATRLATVGSIGVITVHQEMTKMLDQIGIKATVFRAGEFKALGGPMEALTTKAKNIIQGRLDQLYNEFVNHVALSRNRSVQDVKDNMADGREFFGHEAVSAGLIDGVMTIDSLMAKLHKPAKAQSSTPVRLSAETQTTDLSLSTRTEASDMPRKILSPEAVAAAAAEGIVLATPEVPEVVETVTTEETTETVETVESTEEAATQTPEVKDEAPASDGVVTYLKAELAEANQKILDLTVDNRELKKSLDAVNSTHAQMRDIVEASANNKRVALGGSSSDLSSLSDEALLLQHAQTHAEFSKVFPVGGRTPLPSTEQPTEAAAITPLQQAQLRTVQSARKRT